MEKESLSIGLVNTMSQQRFIHIFGNIFEKSPFIAAAVSAKRPFKSIDHLYHVFCDFIDHLPVDVQEGILMINNDLGDIARERLLVPLSTTSAGEQGSAGIMDMGQNEIEKLYQITKQYRQTFGFPFYLCCRMHDKESLMSELESRIKNSHCTERYNCLQELKKVAKLRFHDIINGQLDL